MGGRRVAFCTYFSNLLCSRRFPISSGFNSPLKNRFFSSSLLPSVRLVALSSCFSTFKSAFFLCSRCLSCSLLFFSISIFFATFAILTRFICSIFLTLNVPRALSSVLLLFVRIDSFERRVSKFRFFRSISLASAAIFAFSAAFALAAAFNSAIFLSRSFFSLSRTSNAFFCFCNCISLCLRSLFSLFLRLVVSFFCNVFPRVFGLFIVDRLWAFCIFLLASSLTRRISFA